MASQAKTPIRSVRARPAAGQTFDVQGANPAPEVAETANVPVDTPEITVQTAPVEEPKAVVRSVSPARAAAVASRVQARAAGISTTPGPKRLAAIAARERAAALDMEPDDEMRERRIEKLGGRRQTGGKNGGQRGAGRGPKPLDDDMLAEENLEPVLPAVGPARLRKRHYGVLGTFVLFVLLPIVVTGWYLWTHAVDQYESQVGFAVRAEGQSATPDIFGGLLGTPSSSTTEDMHILNEYILSQEIVELIDAKLDLRKRYAVSPDDPVYSFNADGTIEDLVSYWQRMVVVNFDAGTGLMDLTIYAFTPQDAQDIAAAVLAESNNIVNNLSAIAREDSTRYARAALENARTRADDARAALTEFRAKNRVADPSADVASQMGVVNSLQQQLATALVDLDLIRATGKENDPRIVQLERRIVAIEGRIDQERANLGIGNNGSDFAEVLSEYERLTVDKTFAEQTYLAALAGFDSAMSNASQQSRYLASYVTPTLAEASTAPIRPLVTLVVGLILFFIWASGVLIYYALRDRR